MLIWLHIAGSNLLSKRRVNNASEEENETSITSVLWNQRLEPGNDLDVAWRCFVGGWTQVQRVQQNHSFEERCKNGQALASRICTQLLRN